MRNFFDSALWLTLQAMYQLRLRLLIVKGSNYLVLTFSQYQNLKVKHHSELSHEVRELVVLHRLEFVPCFQYLPNHLWYTKLQVLKAPATELSLTPAWLVVFEIELCKLRWVKVHSELSRPTYMSPVEVFATWIKILIGLIIWLFPSEALEHLIFTGQRSNCSCKF